MRNGGSGHGRSPAGLGAPLSAATEAWLGGADLDHRRRLGQFMTPAVLRRRLVDRLRLAPGMRVLDPGVGTGELLRAVLDREPAAVTTGWDVDPAILDVARGLVPEAHLERRDALAPYAGPPFDVVIGNPPYFQVPSTPALRERFGAVISGRPNIFALFFLAGLDCLRDGGQLAYVVPPSMNNGAYFEALREYVVAHARIDHLDVVSDPMLFADAQTAVQVIVLTKGAGSDRFTFRRGDGGTGFRRVVFTDRPRAIAAQFAGRRTLHDLGYEAVTGSLVWNQHRDRLRRRTEPGAVPLLWAHNVDDGALRLDPDHPRRPQYVRTGRGWAGPAIVVNRVVGAVGSARLRCAPVPDGMAFVAENHVNVVRRRRDAEPRVGWDGLLAALRDPAVGERVRLLTGNTQLSATELTHLVPLDA